MNILIISRPLSPPWNEGGKNLAYGIIKNIKEHNFYVFTIEDTVDFGRNVIPIKLPKTKGSKYTSFLEISWLHKILIFLTLLKNDKHIDLYHFIFTHNSICSLYANIISKLKSKPTIQNLTTYSSKQNWDNKRNIFADSIVVFTKFRKDSLKKKGFKNVVNINLGVDPKKFNPKRNVKSLKSKLKIANEPIILFAGHYLLSGVSEQLVLIVNKVIKKIPNVKFIFACRLQSKQDFIIKKGMIRKFLRLGIDKSIIFIDHVKNMHNLINLCDIGIYPTTTEYPKLEVPMVLLELMSSGKPVIITDIPPQNDIMKYDKRIGIVVKKGDVKEFSNAIIRLIKNKKLRETMGKRGRQVILKHYNIRKIAKKYKKLYEDTIKWR
jgi:phosphatidylinositol alpha-1,6-mannosyltransferase